MSERSSLPQQIMCGTDAIGRETENLISFIFKVSYHKMDIYIKYCLLYVLMSLVNLLLLLAKGKHKLSLLKEIWHVKDYVYGCGK